MRRAGVVYVTYERYAYPRRRAARLAAMAAILCVDACIAARLGPGRDPNKQRVARAHGVKFLPFRKQNQLS